ncbi:helix-turn-helix domain-containing protein [Salipiger bermudensis]|uniref:helix-turn-helix domain-containing protein n=1 Tax=Salipiger bermudensis TaxID=344736 RepID=UPI001CD6A4E6|nr:helix-turn-helix transcriptional regulator [Salipiger bermudensis]MCA0964351.1 helix-turn-helix domain-containing protein [Salipiger bermudensis]
MTLEQRLSAQLRQYRRSAGLTQNELAQRIGAHVQQIYRYETGAGRIPAAQLWLISQTLGIPIAEFFTESDSPMTAQDQVVFDEVRTAATLLRALAPDERGAVIELLRSMAQGLQTNKKAAPHAEQPRIRAAGC